MTKIEKGLKIIAKQIKALDDNAILLSELNYQMALSSARANLYNIITKHGYTLEIGTYKLIKK